MKTITVKYCTSEGCVSHYYTHAQLIHHALLNHLLTGGIVGTGAMIFAWFMRDYL